jgi:polysaccharide pyruvyl transferase WcaK-like protein
VLLNHYPQMVVAGTRKVPTLYLPATIGPLRGPAGRLVTGALRGIDVVCVRDPWSYDDLASAGVEVCRLPDMAILDLAEKWDEVTPVSADGHVGVVASNIPHARGHESQIQKAVEGLDHEVSWVAHKEGDRSKSDSVHLTKLGLSVTGRLTDLVDDRKLSAVISVRLHAAIMAIAAGVPAIHLAYDRKGPGAFADLGVEDWCFDVRSFNPEDLRGALERILTDPDSYWEKVGRQIPALRKQSHELDQMMQQTLKGPAPAESRW